MPPVNVLQLCVQSRKFHLELSGLLPLIRAPAKNGLRVAAASRYFMRVMTFDFPQNAVREDSRFLLRLRPSFTGTYIERQSRKTPQR